jgi:DNA repair exonuclease SbcCD ATPase subunit
MSNTLKAALSEYRQSRVQLSQIEKVLSTVKRAYLDLDNARARLEEIQTELRELDVPLYQDSVNDLDDAIDLWLANMYPISEDILDWTGRDDD